MVHMPIHQHYGTTFGLKLESAASALDVNKAQTKVVVAGRNGRKK